MRFSADVHLGPFDLGIDWKQFEKKSFEFVKDAISSCARAPPGLI